MPEGNAISGKAPLYTVYSDAVGQCNSAVRWPLYFNVGAENTMTNYFLRLDI